MHQRKSRTYRRPQVGPLQGSSDFRASAALAAYSSDDWTTIVSIGKRFAYKAEATKGVLKKNIGRATGNRRLQMEGRVDQATGNTKNAGERVKEAFTNRPPYRTNRNRRQVVIMIVLGLILLVAGYLLGIGILSTLGVVLLVVGLILLVMGSMGRPVGRRHYF